MKLTADWFRLATCNPPYPSAKSRHRMTPPPARLPVFNRLFMFVCEFSRRSLFVRVNRTWTHINIHNQMVRGQWKSHLKKDKEQKMCFFALKCGMFLLLSLFSVVKLCQHYNITGTVGGVLQLLDVPLLLLSVWLVRLKECWLVDGGW